MANTLLNSTKILAKSLDVLHNNLSFTRGVNREYDGNYANSGAKIGSTLQVRLPNRYTIRSGKPINVQDQAEETVTITCATQKGVDMNFSSAELTMDIDKFSERYINPAMAKIASLLDYEGMSLYKDIYNYVGAAGTTPATALVALQAGQKLNESATPQDERSISLNPAANAAMVNGLAGLFNPGGVIGENYRKGMMGSGQLGFAWAMDQNVNSHTCGTRTASGAATINGTAAEGATSLVLAHTGSVTYKQGDVFSVADCYAVNPETGQSTGALAQFIVTADASGTTTATVSVSPSCITVGAKATLNSLPASGKAVTFGGVASTSYPQNMAYHKDAFTLATADLELPKGVDFASRAVVDGISMRIVRAYDINNDNFPCRIDVFYGWKTIRPSMACRITG